jgi:hypothetical protein
MLEKIGLTFLFRHQLRLSPTSTPLDSLYLYMSPTDHPNASSAPPLEPFLGHASPLPTTHAAHDPSQTSHTQAADELDTLQRRPSPSRSSPSPPLNLRTTTLSQSPLNSEQTPTSRLAPDMGSPLPSTAPPPPPSTSPPLREHHAHFSIGSPRDNTSASSRSASPHPTPVPLPEKTFSRPSHKAETPSSSPPPPSLFSKVVNNPILPMGWVKPHLATKDLKVTFRCALAVRPLCSLSFPSINLSELGRVLIDVPFRRPG